MTFTESVPRTALRKLQNGVAVSLTPLRDAVARLFRTYRFLSVRSDATSSNRRNKGLNGDPSKCHLVQQSRLAAPVPQGLSVAETLWPAPHPGARERQAALNLAARRDLMAFVYGRPS